MTTIAWINNETNICENVSQDDRPASEIIVPGYTLIDLDETPSTTWKWDETLLDWVQVDENLGEGGIGDTYIDGKLVEPKPTYTPPSTGLEEF